MNKLKCTLFLLMILVLNASWGFSQYHERRIIVNEKNQSIESENIFQVENIRRDDTNIQIEKDKGKKLEIQKQDEAHKTESIKKKSFIEKQRVDDTEIDKDIQKSLFRSDLLKKPPSAQKKITEEISDEIDKLVSEEKQERKSIPVDENVSYDTRCYCTITPESNDAAGITNFSFHTINNSSSGEPYYSDYTDISTTVVKGQEYEISVRVNTAGNWTQHVRVWIDWNDNCVFDASEEYDLGTVANQTNGLTSNSPLSITIPETAVAGTTRIRVRTRDGDAPTACDTHNWSEAEDYSLIIVEPNSTPAANFTANQTTVMGAGIVEFTDLSDNRPNQWDWSFPGGIPSVSNEQNPSVAYMTPGTYNVSLTATNDLGSDTETKTQYIYVQNPVEYEEIVVIMDGEQDFYTWVFPLGWTENFRYIRSAAIYTPEEIGQAGVIEYLAWYTGVAQGNRPGKIYIKHFDGETFSSTSTWENIIDDASLVWEGEFDNPEADWVAFNLDENFFYNGQQKLMVLVEVDGHNSDNDSESYVQEKISSFQTWAGDAAPPTGQGVIQDYRPIIALLFSSKPSPPTSNFINPALYDGFENYNDFSLNFSPWTMFDEDRSPTYGIQDVSFPNEGYIGSFIIFNPSQTSPPLGGDWLPYSGNKYAASFAAIDGPNDDWLITPKVQLGTNSSVSFWVKSIADDWGLERFRVGVSLDEPIPEDFVIISTEPHEEAPVEWTRFEFNLNAYNNEEIYLAINCVSDDSYVFMLDDVVIHTEGVDINIFEGEYASFFDTSTGNPEVWVWDMPGSVGELSTEKNVSMQYTEAGTYDVQLTTANFGGSNTHTKTNFVNVHGRAPLGNFYVTNFDGFINDKYQPFIPTGGTIDFFDYSAHYPRIWNWTFQDGVPGSSVQQNPAGIVYNNMGRFNVTLNVENSFGTDNIFAQRLVNVGCCDYITNIMPGDGLTYYVLNIDGYIPGHNDYQNAIGQYAMTAYAEQFWSNHSGDVDKVDMLVVFSEGDSDVIISIWDDDGGFPGNLIASKTMSMRDFVPLEWNEIEFDSPVTVTGTFYIGYQIQYDNPHDFENHMFLIAMAQDRGPGAYESIYAIYDNQWENLDDLFGGLTSSLAIIPHYCYDGAEPITFTIEASAGVNGAVNPSGDVIVSEGTNQSFTIFGDFGYHVDDVIVNGESIGATDSYTFEEVWEDQTIQASFAINYYEIRVICGPNGSVTPGGNASVVHGGSASFEFDPDEGYIIESVLVNGESIGNPANYSFSNVTDDQLLEVFFIKTHTIFSTSFGNGDIIPSGEVEVNHGSYPIFEIEPDPGNFVGNVLVDLESIGPVFNYQFSYVSSDRSVHAVFTSSDIPGDVNGDGKLDVLDVVWLVQHINDNSPLNFILLNADVNNDTEITIADVTSLISIILSPDKSEGHSAPPDHGSNSGPNPDFDVVYYPEPKATHIYHYGTQPLLILEKETIMLSSEGNLTALHFELLTKEAENISAKMIIPGYRLSCSPKEGTISCVIYSLSLTPFPQGEIELLKLEGINHENEIYWGKTDGSDIGHNNIKLKGVVK